MIANANPDLKERTQGEDALLTLERLEQALRNIGRRLENDLEYNSLTRAPSGALHGAVTADSDATVTTRDYLALQVKLLLDYMATHKLDLLDPFTEKATEFTVRLNAFAARYLPYNRAPDGTETASSNQEEQLSFFNLDKDALLLFSMLKDELKTFLEGQYARVLTADPESLQEKFTSRLNNLQRQLNDLGLNQRELASLKEDYESLQDSLNRIFKQQGTLKETIKTIEQASEHVKHWPELNEKLQQQSHELDRIRESFINKSATLRDWELRLTEKHHELEALQQATQDARVQFKELTASIEEQGQQVKTQSALVNRQKKAVKAQLQTAKTLLDGSAAHALSEAFRNKVKEAKNSQTFWFIILILTLFTIVIINTLSFTGVFQPAGTAAPAAAVEERSAPVPAPVYTGEPPFVDPYVDTIAVIREVQTYATSTATDSAPAAAAVTMSWKDYLVNELLCLPLFWLAWLATRNLSLAIRLREDYAYKEVATLTYIGYRDSARRLDSSETPAQMEKRVLDSIINRLDENPLRLYERAPAGSPLHELLTPFSRAGTDKAMVQALAKAIVESLTQENPPVRDRAQEKKDISHSDRKDEG